MSAWIEIYQSTIVNYAGAVALLVSAWIEISLNRITKTAPTFVALLVSAWIEMLGA